MSTSLDMQLSKHQTVGKRICQQMVAAIEKTGFSLEEMVGVPQFDCAEFSLQTDPYTQDENLNGTWFNTQRQRIGSIQFLSDGSFYAEYDVVKPHPSKPKWFVEAMTAWGNVDNIKTEAKLLPMAE